MTAGIEDRIRDCLAPHREVVAAYLFGSRAEGRAHRESDVDVAVLLDRQLCPDAKDRFEKRIDALRQIEPVETFARIVGEIEGRA